MNKQKIYGYILILIGVYFILFMLNPPKKENEQEQQVPQNTIVVEAEKKEYTLGDTIKIRVKNKFPTPITINGRCPYPPFDIYKNNEKVEGETSYTCNNTPTTISGSGETLLSMDLWSNTIFQTTGTYTVRYTTAIDNEEKTFETAVHITEKGWLGNLWDTVFYRPIYNLLILLISVLPNKDLGLAIILLTLIIRFVLLIPNQKALEQQKKLNQLQPKLTEIRKKYEGDQQKIGEETMKLWKEYKVNPMGSCLPMLLQLPFLIALYTAVANGLHISSSFYLYPPLQGFNIEQVETLFLGILDLSTPNTIVLPIVIGILQFLQMKLSLQNNAKKKKTEVIPSDKKESTMDPTATMNKSMLYVFPLLIAFMAAGFPAGVSLYWGVTTIFGILQQLWVNREKISV